jgi:hypothetical protein
MLNEGLNFNFLLHPFLQRVHSTSRRGINTELARGVAIQNLERRLIKSRMPSGVIPKFSEV